AEDVPAAGGSFRHDFVLEVALEALKVNRPSVQLVEKRISKLEHLTAILGELKLDLSQCVLINATPKGSLLRQEGGDVEFPHCDYTAKEDCQEASPQSQHAVEDDAQGRQFVAVVQVASSLDEELLGNSTEVARSIVDRK